MNYDDSHIERALGVTWFVTSDEFGFVITPSSKPPTRRGVLSIVSSVYDPLGIVAPVILHAKKILQDLCKETSLGWDDVVPEPYLSRWHKWIGDLPLLEQLKLPRCFKPATFGDVISRQLHIFSDASTVGYSSCAYLRLLNSSGDIHCAFVMGKARLAPTKVTSIPRLELTAATVSIRLGMMLNNEMELPPESITYHTDSMAVLHTIRNETKRFPVFTANRVQLIRDFSEPQQWRFVDTAANSADDGSRGLHIDVMLKQRRWLTGPEFLSTPETQWREQPVVFESHNDCNTTDVSATSVGHDVCPLDKLISYFSDWHRLCRAVVHVLRVRRRLHERKADVSISDPITVDEINEAETSIIRYTQMKYFNAEMEILNESSGQQSRNAKSKTGVPRSSSIYSLDPFIDKTGIIRVGGRLSKASLPYAQTHPILLPRKSHVTTLVIRHHHERLQHSGRNHVLAALRERYWVIAGNAAVRQIISGCVKCKKSRAPVIDQKMADLPSARASTEPPFTYTGLDYFGPFVIKDGRKQVKRWGVIFTCLSSRSVFLESANTLDTDSFINCLRRFQSRRGVTREIWSDNGTNFVGGEKELRCAIEEIDQTRVHNTLLKVGIKWHFNPPGGSHMGGVWERQIRTVRKVLTQLFHEFGHQIDDEMFRTLLCETESIVNSRPLTTISDNPDDLEPLTPNHLLTLKTSTLAPPGVFDPADVYSRKRWRRVQYLVEQFWSRWKREYLLTLQRRHKWSTPRRNLQISDVVLLKDDNLPRNQWSLGRVIRVESDSSGVVRCVIAKTQTSELRRPVSKCVLLIPGNS